MVEIRPCGCPEKCPCWNEVCPVVWMHVGWVEAFLLVQKHLWMCPDVLSPAKEICTICINTCHCAFDNLWVLLCHCVWYIQHDPCLLLIHCSFVELFWTAIPVICSGYLQKTALCRLQTCFHVTVQLEILFQWSTYMKVWWLFNQFLALGVFRKMYKANWMKFITLTVFRSLNDAIFNFGQLQSFTV